MELSKPLMNLIVWLTVIAGLAIGAWYLIGLYWMHSRREEKELTEVDLPGDLHEVFSGVPPAMTIAYVFVFIFGIAYVIYIWQGGITY